jgi:hypothetical protein
MQCAARENKSVNLLITRTANSAFLAERHLEPDHKNDYPVISQPDLGVYPERENGIGDIQFSTFLSPKAVKGGLVWGAGAVVQLDTATDDRLGQGVWGVGPTAVVLKLGDP